MDKINVSEDIVINEEVCFENFNLESYLTRLENKKDEEYLRETAKNAANNNETEAEKDYEQSVEDAQRKADLKHIEVRSENNEKLWCGITNFILWILEKGKYVILAYFIILLVLYVFNCDGAKNLENAIKSAFGVVMNGSGGAILAYFAIKSKSR